MFDSIRLGIIKSVGDSLDNKENERKKSSFKLGNFIKEKILRMYGINKKNSGFFRNKQSDSNEVESSDLLPHDNTKF